MPRIFIAVALLTTAAQLMRADQGTPSSATRQMLNDRIAEEARHPAPKAALGDAKTAAAQQAQADESRRENPLLMPAPHSDKDANARAAAASLAAPPTVLPKIEIRKDRISPLDKKLETKDREIAREQQNAVPSELDKALNNSKLARSLAVFGGESSDFRGELAAQRVSLLQDEKDLLVEIAHAKTKTEKTVYQGELDRLRQERRELEQALK